MRKGNPTRARGCDSRSSWKTTLLIAFCLPMAASAGCAAVSLFSSTHYHGTKETDDRLTSLEQRVAALEANRANTSNQAPVVLPTPTPAPNNVPR